MCIPVLKIFCFINTFNDAYHTFYLAISRMVKIKSYNVFDKDRPPTSSASGRYYITEPRFI